MALSCYRLRLFTLELFDDQTKPLNDKETKASQTSESFVFFELCVLFRFS